MPSRVLIIEDHTLMRESVRRLLEARPDLVVVGDLTSAKGADEFMRLEKPDIVIMDLGLPGEDGMELMRRLKEEHELARFIVYTGQLEPSLVRTALDIGASGFVRKTSGASELLSAIDTALRGEIFLCPATTTSLIHSAASRPGDGIDAGAVRLTERELSVLRLIVKGLRNKEIADALGISVKTVETHRARVMSATGCSSPAELVRFAIRRGLAEL